MDNYLDLKFKSGFVFLKDTQVLIFPLNYFLCLFDIIIENKTNENLDLIFENLVRKDTIFSYNKIKNFKIQPTHKIHYFLEYLNSLGLGFLKLNLVSNNKIIFTIQNIYLSKVYKNLFKKKPSYLIENLLLKYLELFLSLLYNKEISSKIILKNNSIFFDFTISSNNLHIISENNDFKYPIVNYNLNPFFSNLIKTNKIYITSGVFKIIDAYAVSIPYFLYISIFENLNNVDIKKINILAQIQGRASVEMHKKMFGILDKDVFNSVVNFSDVSGFGKITIPENNYCLLNIINNYSYYLNYFSKNTIDLFNLNLVLVCFGVFKFSFQVNSKFKIINYGNVEYEKIDDKLLKLSSLESKFSNLLSTKVLVSNSL